MLEKVANIRKSDMSPGKTEVKQGNFVEFISRRRVVLEKLKNHKTYIQFLQSLNSPRVYKSMLKAYQLVFSG